MKQLAKRNLTWKPPFSVRSTAFGSRELLGSIRKSYFPPGTRVGAVLGLVRSHGDRVPQLQSVPGKTRSLQSVRGITFQAPIRYLAAPVLHVDVEVDVRIGPL